MAKQPISERRLAANRANAQKSTGPRTAEGKLRVSRNATRHNLYSGPHRLPEDIEARLYHQALEQTADIADPRFRALLVQRMMLRGHERRLFQLEGKLWAEALRVNDEVIPQAALWIRENQGEVVQALGRYHAWICVRIRAIQKSVFPYLTGDVAHQAAIPARVQALFAAAAGSTRPIALTTQAGATLTNSVTADDQAPESSNSNLVPPPGLQLHLGARGACRPVRPVPAPQPVKAIRPPAVPGLRLRCLKQSRKPTPSIGAAANGAASVNERIANRNAPTSHPPLPPVPPSPAESRNPLSARHQTQNRNLRPSQPQPPSTPSAINSNRAARTRPHNPVSRSDQSQRKPLHRANTAERAPPGQAHPTPAQTHPARLTTPAPS